MNRCKCPEPPGGTVVCEEGQLAICVVRYGKAEGSCHNLPTKQSLPGGIDEFIGQANFTLNLVTGRDRNLGQQLTDLDMMILKEGYYKRSDGAEVSFRFAF